MVDDKARLSIEEFEGLVAELKGDCDKCKRDCLDRLRWMDSIIESLRYQLAKSLAMNRLLLEAVDKVADFKYIDKELARLTARILQDDLSESSPQYNAGEQECREGKDSNHSRTLDGFVKSTL